MFGRLKYYLYKSPVASRGKKRFVLSVVCGPALQSGIWILLVYFQSCTNVFMINLILSHIHATGTDSAQQYTFKRRHWPKKLPNFKTFIVHNFSLLFTNQIRWCIIENRWVKKLRKPYSEKLHSKESDDAFPHAPHTDHGGQKKDLIAKFVFRLLWKF